jgi:AraC family ethanolamine operon transcriptional activator
MVQAIYANTGIYRFSAILLSHFRCLPHQKNDMFNVETQKAESFHSLDTLQFGWDFRVSQLSPVEEISQVSLYQTAHVGYNRFHFGAAFDQSLHSNEGLLSFGLFEPDNPITWAYDQVIPNDAIIIFASDEDLRGASPVGFRGNGIHFSESFMANLAEKVYNRSLISLLPAPGLYEPSLIKVGVLRAELRKWQQLQAYNADTRLAIVARREESLVLAILDALIDAETIDKGGLIKSERSMTRALELIHTSEMKNISAVELCTYAECNPRFLERTFQKRFGVTPKKYIKYLRLARVRDRLLTFDTQSCESIIELAGIQGFWHMGQFAADYRRVYGELPSETVNQN